jgi:DNA-binding transcriptional regulator YdaS (Cro superfamily)
MKRPLEKVLDLCDGKIVVLSQKSGISHSTISAWINRFSFLVGSGYVISVSQAVDWRVTPHELRPDIYPHPEDGLPDELRCQCKQEAV